MKQSSGDNSNNVQAGGNVVIGISASEAHQIALNVFKANFYEFSQEAAQKALQKAEEITDKFIEEFYRKIPHLEHKLQEPAVQSSIFAAQKEYAKAGDFDMKEQLTELLIQRVNSDERSLKQIVLDEAISLLPKLTKDHIDVLSLIFSAVYLNHTPNNLEAFNTLLRERIIPFFPEKPTSYSFFTHLQYTGCCTLLGEGSTYKPIEEIFHSRFKGLFSKGFSIKQYEDEFVESSTSLQPLVIRSLYNPLNFQFNALNDEVLEKKISLMRLDLLKNRVLSFQNSHLLNIQEFTEDLLVKDQRLKLMTEDWKNKDYKIMKPTSVGFAIGILNYIRKTNHHLPVEHFI